MPTRGNQAPKQSGRGSLYKGISTMSSSSDESESDIKMVSIYRGDMGTINFPQRQPSWSDFEVLMRRVQSLEEEQQCRRRRPLEEQATIEADDKKFADPDLEHDLQNGRSDGGVANGVEQGMDGATVRRNTTRMTLSMVDRIEDKYQLPESTYTLLTTEPIFSIPFFAGLVTSAMIVACLALALENEVDDTSPDNPFGVPPDVRREVHMAQFLGVIVGLELIGKYSEQEISGGNRFGMRRVVFPSLLRIGVGYLFISCLFMTVIQESSVIDIFFDVLALEFVENIDDVIFGLCRRGFFGRKLRLATNNIHYIVSSREGRTCRRWTKRFIRSIYILNILGGIALLSYITVRQKRAHFRCEHFFVDFGDALWEEALVSRDGKNETQVLIYSHFNGLFVENGTHGGRPKYVEQNKEDGDPFKITIPAEIVYCEEIESWVFRHDHIMATNNYEHPKNECNWLIRSSPTESYDIADLSKPNDWSVWTGFVEQEYDISILCTECDDRQSCGNHGECEEDVCVCDPEFFGTFCQFDQPCSVIHSEKDRGTRLKLVGDPNDEEGEDFVEMYGRPLYLMEHVSGKPDGLLHFGYSESDDIYSIQIPEHFFSNLFGNPAKEDDADAIAPHKHEEPGYPTDDDFFENNNVTAEFQRLLTNYSFALYFTGRRWFGKILPPGMSASSIVEEEYHAFWNRTVVGTGVNGDRVLLVSDPSPDLGSPVGVDFYEMRQRSHVNHSTQPEDFDHGPFGVLVPLVEFDSSGFFHCEVPHRHHVNDTFH